MEESTKIEEKGKKKSNFIKDWIIPIFCALVIAFLLRQFVFLMYMCQQDQ
ncbi:signal peptidase I [Clostridium beijerinckii]|nr:signal peptidase I [Clostridium beijerinckii]